MTNFDQWPHRWYGRWRETRGLEAEDIPSIHEALGWNWDDHELRKVVAYLRAGALAIFSPGVAKSILGGDKIIGTHSWLTDGVWLWPETLAHYVETDKVRLPPVFLRHIQRNGYAMPPHAGMDKSRLEWPK